MAVLRSASETEIPERTRVCCSAGDDQYLIEALLKYQDKYYQQPTLDWDPDVWHRCLRVLRDKGSKKSVRRSLTEDKLARHFRKLRDDLYIILRILSSEEHDFEWDEEDRCIDGEEDDWEDYLKSNPHHKRFRQRQYTIFDGMMTLCTIVDPESGDHKFKARGIRNEMQRVVLPAAKYRAPERDSATSGLRPGAAPPRRMHKGKQRADHERRRPGSSRASSTPEFSHTNSSVNPKSHDAESIPSLIQHAADAVGDRLIAIYGVPVMASEAQTQKRAVEILEAYAHGAHMSEQEFVEATRCFTEHKDVALSYVTVKTRKWRNTYLKAEMEKRGYYTGP